MKIIQEQGWSENVFVYKVIGSYPKVDFVLRRPCRLSFDFDDSLDSIGLVVVRLPARACKPAGARP